MLLPCERRLPLAPVQLGAELLVLPSSTDASSPSKNDSPISRRVHHHRRVASHLALRGIDAHSPVREEERHEECNRLRGARKRRVSDALLRDLKLFFGLLVLHHAPRRRPPPQPARDEPVVLSSDGEPQLPAVEVVDELPDKELDHRVPEPPLPEAYVLLEHLPEIEVDWLALEHQLEAFDVPLHQELPQQPPIDWALIAASSLPAASP